MWPIRLFFFLLVRHPSLLRTLHFTLMPSFTNIFSAPTPMIRTFPLTMHWLALMSGKNVGDDVTSSREMHRNLSEYASESGKNGIFGISAHSFGSPIHSTTSFFQRSVLYSRDNSKARCDSNAKFSGPFLTSVLHISTTQMKSVENFWENGGNVTSLQIIYGKKCAVFEQSLKLQFSNDFQISCVKG